MTTRTFRAVVLALLVATGCTFDEFVDESYALISERNPEMQAWYGYSQEGEPLQSFDDVSIPYLERTYAIEAAVLEKLLEFDYEKLTREQRITYNFYRQFLETDIAGRDFSLNNLWYGEELRLAGSGGVYFYDLAVTDYSDALKFARDLGKLKRRFAQLLDTYQTAAKADLIPARSVVETQVSRLRYDCGQYEPDAEYLVYREMLQFKVEEAGLSLTPEQWAELEMEIERSTQLYRPSCEKLLAWMTDVAERAPAEGAGAWVFPNGQAYYQSRLKFHNESPASPQEIHDMGIDALASIHQQLRDLLAPHGYPVERSITELMVAVDADCPRVTLDELTATYVSIIDDAKAKLGTVVDLPPPQGELLMVYEEGVPGGYGPASLDGAYPATFYYGLPVGEEDTSSMALKTIAYHEVYAGHHMQLGAQAEMTGVPWIRKTRTSTAYVEGWGLYSERLAAELGWYEDGDLCGQVGRLMTEGLRAARLSVDTGLHALKWTPAQAVAFMDEQLGVGWSPISNVDEVYGSLRMPAYKTAYYVGMQKMLQLREDARNALGAKFDLVEFNRLILGSGNITVSVLERIVADYLADKQ